MKQIHHNKNRIEKLCLNLMRELLHEPQNTKGNIKMGPVIDMHHEKTDLKAVPILLLV